MRTKFLFPLIAGLCSFPSIAHIGFAQGTTFTYQGRLSENGVVADTVYDFRFRLAADGLGNTIVSTNVFVEDLPISNGLFTVSLDFGDSVFDGSPRWLEIGVRAGASTGAYTLLTPLQPLSSTPYAIRAETAVSAGSAAAVTGPIPDSLLSSNVALLASSPTFTGMLSAPRAGIGTNTSGAALQVAGGTNTLSGAILRLLNVITNNSPSVGVSNMSAPINVFISGTRAYVTAYFPGALEIFDVSNPQDPRFLGEAVDSSAQPGSPFTRLNGASGIFVTNNIAYVTAENDNALTIINVSNPQDLVKLAEIVDGSNGFNGLNLPTGVIVAGTNCFVLGFFDSALTILDISNPANPTLVKEIFDDSVNPGSPFTKLKWPYQMTLVGTRLYIACRGDSAITILDVANPANPQLLGEIADVTVVTNSPFTRLAGANWVDVVGNVAYVAAGAFNSSLGSLTLIDVSNPANPIKLAEVNDDSINPGSPFTKLRGAWAVKVARNVAFVTSFADNAITAIDVSDPRNPRLLRELADGAGGFNHLAFTEGLTVSGVTLYVVGDTDNALNLIDLRTQLGLFVDQYVGVGTATPRSALEVAGVVTAGGLNVEGAVVVGGNGEFGNLAARGSVVVDTLNTNNGSRLPGLAFGSGGGEGIASKRTPGAAQYGLDLYTASQRRMHVANNGNVGIGNAAPNHRLSISGGPTWTANAWSGAVELENGAALGWQSNAAGQRFGMGHSGGGFYFFRTTSDPGTFTNAATYDLVIGDSGNVGIGTTTPSQRLHVIGNILASGTITPNSDRNAKTNITSLDPATVLERLAKLPIQQWRFKTEAEGVRHFGPMAQDFYAAFGLGEHKTAIATVDADGVALAAIQGLNQKLEEKDAELLQLEHQYGLLERRFEALEHAMHSLAEKQEDR